MLWQRLVRPVLFRLPAEAAHHWAMNVWGLCDRILPVPSARFNDRRLAVEVAGLSFSTPLGLAAGFDKNGRWVSALARLGFGHIEVGTVTAQPQPGNSPPRLFRLPRDRALINRLGFNNDGCDRVAVRLAKRSAGPPQVGVNIGKSRVAPVDAADRDYQRSFECLWRHADYFTINVSSPNTPGLRQLQQRQPLERLLTGLQQLNHRLAVDRPPRPLLVKVAPDLTDSQLLEVAEIVLETGCAGIVATNTTVERTGLRTPAAVLERIGAGGLSGAPLTARSRRIVRLLYRHTRGRLALVGAGGVMSGADAWQLIRNGASLVQVYTGFVYGGPRFARHVLRYLVDQLDRSGLESITQAIGADV